MKPDVGALLQFLTDKDALAAYTLREYDTESPDWPELAFRLRDEAVAADFGLWTQGCVLVHRHVRPDTTRTIYEWYLDDAQPEHYIVAALIAQHLKENPDV